MFRRKHSQLRDHPVGARRQHPVAANEIGVVVDEPRLPALEPSRGVKIKKDGAAAEKRFDLALESDRIESA
jgi:hypothetical protein